MRTAQGFTGKFVVLGISIIFLMLGWGCSTQKNSLPNRLYHSINSKYNGYFNARENYREGVRRLSNTHIDNYDQVLSIFRYGNEQQAGSVSNYMDVAYQKASNVIRKHSMNIRGVEYNPWIDESFYLIARSHFFKRDYNLAILTFEYIVRQYESDTKYAAKSWIVKSYIQQGRYDQAIPWLERLEKNQADGVLSRDASRLYHLVFADFYVSQGQYAPASDLLRKGIDLTSSKKERTRLTFILAQIYQHQGDYANAQQTYAAVLKMNPSFDLAFQARISMAMAFDPAGGSRADQIKADLERMLRDDKNRPYQDQIYYALGQLSLRQNRADEAAENFLKSTEVSSENRMQKGLAFTRLGEIFFDRPEYLQASVYYDSAATYLPAQHDEYRQVNERKGILSLLATNIRIISREDSLQKLAAMSDAARNAVIDKIIADLREQEAQDKLIEQQMMRAASTIAQSRMRGGSATEQGGWYFYNTSAMSFGRTEFFSKFGNRPLEDMWRISNKQAAGFDMAMGDEWEEEQEPEGDVFDRNTYLRNIPTTPELLEASNRRMANAYYNKGMAFKDRLLDYSSAISSLETLVDKFPESDKKLYAYYYLYNLYRESGNTARANIFRDRLVADFPDSDFARILGDPNYMQRVLERYQYADQLYKRAFSAFNNAQYDNVITMADEAAALDIPVRLQSQFAYVRALSTGMLGRRFEFRQQLSQVVSNYAGMPVHKPAEMLLASLEIPGSLPITFDEEPDIDVEATQFESIFSYKPDIAHFYVFVVRMAQMEAVQFRNSVHSFNSSVFPEANLSTSSVFLDEGRLVVTVTNFPNKARGMEYLSQITGSNGIAISDPDAVSGFLISVENYPVFYQEKDIDAYLEFFAHYYINR